MNELTQTNEYYLSLIRLLNHESLFELFVENTWTAPVSSVKAFSFQSNYIDSNVDIWSVFIADVKIFQFWIVRQRIIWTLWWQVNRFWTWVQRTAVRYTWLYTWHQYQSLKTSVTNSWWTGLIGTLFLEVFCCKSKLSWIIILFVYKVSHCHKFNLANVHK